jgi:hypothetical protein
MSTWNTGAVDAYRYMPIVYLSLRNALHDDNAELDATNAGTTKTTVARCSCP